MVFACQRNSFLKELDATVLSCIPAELKLTDNGKTISVEGYEVIFDDTVLFPEGGGQPCDCGCVDSVQVFQVIRRGAEAVHFVKEPLEIGKKVKQVVDWDRRFDHMQQHSGQHLITAFADSLYGFSTTAWWLGEEDTFIELDTPNMTIQQIDQLEKVVNEKIREAINVKVDEYEARDPVLSAIRTRGLPKDHVGKVRAVTIEGIETDMCCGTHVQNLSQLQVIKLLYAEKGKKGKINLHFLAGQRVIKRISLMIDREAGITALLNNGPSTHLDLIEKLQKSAKLANKSLQNVLKEIAVSEAQRLKSKNPRPKFFSLHKREADADFMQIFIREIKDTETLIFLTVGEDKGQGQMLLYGDSNYIEALGSQVCSLLEGKGNGKGTRFQAKVQNLSKRSAAENLIKSVLQVV